MTCTLRAMYPEYFLSLEEWHTLLKATQSTREAAILWLLGGSGLCVSEVADLRVEHVDGARGSARRYGNGRKQRTSILPTPVLEALQAHLNGRNEGHVFESRDNGHFSTRQIQRLLESVDKKAGLQEKRPGNVRQRKRITPYLLRHSSS